MRTVDHLLAESRQSKGPGCRATSLTGRAARLPLALVMFAVACSIPVSKPSAVDETALPDPSVLTRVDDPCAQ